MNYLSTRDRAPGTPPELIRISVLLATFNGEKYLPDLLNSLEHQALLPYQLVVGDDGSTDRTLEILDEFVQRAPFPVRVVRHQSNLGFYENFFALTQFVAGDWVAFCDQDDVWLPWKLENCGREISRRPDLSLVLQRAQICSDDLVPTRRRFPEKEGRGLVQEHQRFGFWVWPGFLQTVRADVFQLNFSARPRSYFRGHVRQPHDKWVCMIANAVGGVLFVDRVSALYRRHALAITGQYDLKSFETRVREAMRTGSEYYGFLSEVANESANYLESLDTEHVLSPSGRQKVLEASCHFRTLASVQRMRSDLYTGNGAFSHCRTLVRITLHGGYFGRKFYALGVKSLLKDLFSVCLGRRA